MPKTPTPFFSTRAPVSRVSEASDKMEPSTGTTPEMVTRAAFTAAASAPEDMTPDMVIYMVKPMSRILKEAKHSHRRKPAAFCKVGFSLISPAAHKMMNRRMAGNTRFFPRESSSPAPISVALEAITEDTGLPEAAMADTKAGIIPLSKASISSKASWQAVSRLPVPARAMRATAHTPAMDKRFPGRVMPEAPAKLCPSPRSTHTAKMDSDALQDSRRCCRHSPTPFSSRERPAEDTMESPRSVVTSCTLSGI